VNTVLGPREGPVGAAWATALATPTAGHTPFVCVLRPGLPTKPLTLFVNKAAIASEARRLTWGAAQAGVAAGVMDAVLAGDVPAGEVDALALIAAVWVDPAALDAEAVYRNNRAATAGALAAGRRREPALAEALAARPSENPFFTPPDPVPATLRRHAPECASARLGHLEDVALPLLEERHLVAPRAARRVVGQLQVPVPVRRGVMRFARGVDPAREDLAVGPSHVVGRELTGELVAIEGREVDRLAREEDVALVRLLALVAGLQLGDAVVGREPVERRVVVGRLLGPQGFARPARPAKGSTTAPFASCTSKCRCGLVEARGSDESESLAALDALADLLGRRRVRLEVPVPRDGLVIVQQVDRVPRFVVERAGAVEVASSTSRIVPGAAATTATLVEHAGPAEWPQKKSVPAWL
jgi:5,6,7,8-tetrahydromethanopterin hydro-lyase